MINGGIINEFEKKLSCTVLATALALLAAASPVITETGVMTSGYVITAQATQLLNSNFNTNYKLSRNYRLDIAAVAQAQKGKTGAQLGAEEQWCADFVCSCAREAGIPTSVLPTNGLCQSLYNSLVKEKGAFLVKKVDDLKQGDIIFFDFDHEKTTHHVAIYLKRDGNKIYYIGGNQGSGNILTRKVTTSTVTWGSNDIYAVVRPNYLKKKSKTKKTAYGEDNVTFYYDDNTYNKYTGVKYFKKNNVKAKTLAKALKEIGAKDYSEDYCAKIALRNELTVSEEDYKANKSKYDEKLIKLLKEGHLIRTREFSKGGKW